MNEVTQKTKLALVLANVFILLTAIGIVYSKHSARNYFIQLERTHETRDKLNNEWTQLLLEQSVWARDGRVEQIARKDLQMITPKPSEILLVKP